MLLQIRAASLMLFGTNEHHLELRVRTLAELAKYSFIFFVGEVIAIMESKLRFEWQN